MRSSSGGSDDPSLDANAIDELLRYDAPVQISRRVTTADVEVDGRSIDAGTFVFVVLGSANRDPAHWGDDADTVDLTRAGAAQHLAFGGGVHHCLGAALARLEGRIALGTMVDALPEVGAGLRRAEVERPPHIPRARRVAGQPRLVAVTGTSSVVRPVTATVIGRYERRRRLGPPPGIVVRARRLPPCLL